MWLILLFALLNAAFGFFGRHVIKFSGFELTPVAIAICAWHGENVLLAGLFLPVAYACTSVYDLKYLWITIPAAIIVGFLALAVHNAYLLLVVYHLLGLSVAYVFTYLDVKYFLFVLVNVAMNIGLARVYGFMT